MNKTLCHRFMAGTAALYIRPNPTLAVAAAALLTSIYANLALGAAPEATMLDWGTDLEHFQVDNDKFVGQRFSFECPELTKRAKRQTIHGTNVYSSDSPICWSALHAGAVPSTGGRIMVQLNPGLDRYVGSKQNGVKSGDRPATKRSMVFVGKSFAETLTPVQREHAPRVKWKTKFTATGLANRKLVGQRFVFKCPKAPDNLRIAGYGDTDFLAALRADDTAGGSNADKQRIQHPSISGSAAQKEIRDAAAYASDVLTVWRRVHMEVDSMGNVTGNNATGNITSLATPATQAATRLNVDINFTMLPSGPDNSVTLPGQNGRFENGTVTIGGTLAVANITGNGNTFLQRAGGFNIVGLPFTASDTGPNNMQGTVTAIAQAGGGWRYTLNVTATTQMPINWANYVGGSIAIGGGAAQGITATNAAGTSVDAGMSIPFTVVDDDTGVGNVAAPNTGSLVATFLPAYVVPVADVGDNNTNVAFQLNVDPFAGQLAGYDFDQVATQNNANFWTIYLLGAYQPESNFGMGIGDGDPATEGVTWGIVDAIGTGQGLRVFSESFNEIACGNPDVTAHEVGHLFGGQHGDGGLMTGNMCPAAGTPFTATTLNRIRSIVNP